MITAYSFYNTPERRVNNILKNKLGINVPVIFEIISIKCPSIATDPSCTWKLKFNETQYTKLVEILDLTQWTKTTNGFFYSETELSQNGFRSFFYARIPNDHSSPITMTYVTD